jgi:hypothetical protein
MKKVSGRFARLLRCVGAALVSLSCLPLAWGNFVGTAAAAEPIVDSIIQQAQEYCDAEQANYRGIDDDLDAPLEGILTLADDAVYQLNLTTDGVMATVLYNEFHCSNIGYSWCGTGGCGFHIIVDGVAFYRVGGFRPVSAIVEDTTFVLIPIHGGGCVTSEGIIGAGVDTCYVAATWDERSKTFRSQGGEINLSPLNP